MTLRTQVDAIARAAARWLAVHTVGAAVTVAALVFTAAAWALADARWLSWPRTVPFVAWLLAIASAAALWWRASRRASRELTAIAAADAVEREGGLRHGMLRGALEVERDGALAERAAELVRDRVGTAWAPSWRSRWRRGAMQMAALGSAAVVVAIVTSRLAPDGWAAAVHPLRAAAGTLVPPLEIEAPALAVRGSVIEAAVAADGRRTISVRLHQVGAPWQTRTLEVRNGRALLPLGRAEADLALVATDGRQRSDTTVIRVVERPYIGDLTVRAVYPAYLGREAEDLAPGDAMRVPRGTRLVMSALASVPVTSVALRAGGESRALVVGRDGSRVTGELVADRSLVWGWTATARDSGPTIELPRPLAVDVLPDSAPLVVILSPARDTTTALGERIPVTIAAQDDHGLGVVRLWAWRRLADGGERALGSVTLADAPGAAWSGVQVLDAAARGLEPGDALRIVAEAVDASPWKQLARSREVLLRVPSLDEQRALAREAADSAAAAAARAATAQRALERKMADEARTRSAAAARGEKTMDFAQAEQAKALAAEQRRAAERARDVAEQAASLERRLQQAGGLDSALSQRLREVQQLLKDALTPEMAEKLRQLEAAASSLSADDAAAQMTQLKQDQQKLREQLERSAALLKRAALEGAMETLKDEAAELAAREQAMADSMAAKGADSSRAAAAKKLAERTERFAKDAEQLQQRLQQEKAQAGADGARDAKAESREAAREMQQAADKAKQDPKQAAQDAKSAAQAMKKAAESLKQGRDAQINEWKKDIAQELDRASQELQQLAQQQQDLAAQAQSGGDPSQMRGDQNAVQQGIEKASERLGATGKSTSLVSQRSQRAMAEAKKQVQDAAKQMADGRQGTAAQRAEAMRRAAEQLQQAAQQLARDRERVNKSESASGFSEMLEDLKKAAQQQGNATQQAQQLMALTPQQRAQQQSALRALAQQQRAIARQLNEAGADDATGKTDAMANEAKKIAERLEQGGPDRETLARQQQLFRRLLDAGKSFEQQEQDTDGQREAKSGRAVGAGAVDGKGSGAAVLAPSAEALRGLSAEERRLVGDYFRRLNALPPR